MARGPVARRSAGFICAAFLATPLVAHAQDAERRFYVARISGSWELVREGRRLGPLDVVPASAAVRAGAGGRASAGDSLVLRDPRTLRTARWSCRQPRSCDDARFVRDLTFEGHAIPRARTTGGLYVRLAEDDELRARVKMVGARAADRYWGLIVLPTDNGTTDVAALRGRIADTGAFVARFCPLSGGTAEDAAECLDSRDVLPSDCDLGGERACSAPGPARAVRVDVFSRERTMLASVATAHALAIVVPRPQARAAMQLAEEAARELRDSKPALSDEEYEGLLAAAAAEIARRLTGAGR